MSFQNRLTIIKKIKLSPKKANFILRELRGKKYSDALLLLKFLPYRACQPLKKSLCSVAQEVVVWSFFNAKNLYVKIAFANHGSAKKKISTKITWES